MKNRDSQIEERLRQIPDIYRKPYLRAIEGKSRKMAIKAQCLECCGWEREEVRLCTDSGCPLWDYRPFRHSKTVDNQQFSVAESTKYAKDV